MASPLPSRAVSNTLSYFNRFDFPLTSDELWFWQHGTDFSKSKIGKFTRTSLAPVRLRRRKFSQPKWEKAASVGESLKIIPTIQAVFVTGSLAMSNCKKFDDIDLMIVTSPHTLWLTRLLVVFYLSIRSLRRSPSLPEHSSPRVSDTICDNLYLDSHHLVFSSPTLYLAHELLQAKPLWDRAGIQHQLLLRNSWVSGYLPVAYRSILKKTPPCRHSLLSRFTWFFWPLNLCAFLVQYLYMKPKMTTERVGLGFAFFHPHSPRSLL